MGWTQSHDIFLCPNISDYYHDTPRVDLFLLERILNVFPFQLYTVPVISNWLVLIRPRTLLTLFSDSAILITIQRDTAMNIPRRNVFYTMNFADSKRIYLHSFHSRKMCVGRFPLFFVFLHDGDYYIRLCVLFHVMEVLKFYG
jgi:hypothetical protein